MTSLQKLLTTSPVLFDGATGTEYQRRGLPIGAAPEQWLFEHPELVEEVHRAYVAAGARVIETCTFGASRKRMEMSGIDRSVAEVNARGVELARNAASGAALIAGSVGPLGGLVEPYGEITVQEAEEIFAEQIDALVTNAVDLILIETMISVDEASIALRMAKQCSAPVVGVTMTFERSGTTVRTPFGETIDDVVRMLQEGGAHFGGANCGAGFDVMLPVAEQFRAATTLPLLMQSNAGIPTVEQGAMIYPETPESFAQFVRTLAQLRIEMIGGCCGTGPEHIQSARSVIFP